MEKSHDALHIGGSAAFTIDGGDEEKLVVLAEVSRYQRRKLDVEAICASIRRAVAQECDVAVHAISILQPGKLLKTSSGKIHRGANRQRFLGGTVDALGQWQNFSTPNRQHADQLGQAADFYLQTQESLELWLRRWVAQYSHSHIDEIAVDVPFESQGVDSINITQLIASIEEWSGFPISIEAVIENDTIETFTQYLLSLDVMASKSSPAKYQAVEGII